MNTLAPAPRAGDLNDAERRLLRAAASGQLLDLSSGDPDLDNPARAAEWPDSRVVRAEVIAGLLTGDRDPDGGKLRAVKLRGARITSPLDLEARTLLCSLLLQDCFLAETPNFSDATAVTIRLPGCHLPGLTAEQLRTTGDLELSEGFASLGEVTLLGARIGGQLDLSGATLTNKGGSALSADQFTVGQGMPCRDGFTATGEVRLLGAHIRGQLDLSGATLTNERGNALNAAELIVDQGMFCRRFKATGEVRLLGAHIGGNLEMDGAALNALTADRLTVDQGMFCRDGFTATGEVRLLGAHIRGQLDFSRATLTNERGNALNADQITVDQNMFCGDGFTAHGGIHLAFANISGQLSFLRGSLAGSDTAAVRLESASVGALLLLPQERPSGNVNLTNARVGTFHDEPDTWPTVIRLRGFVYESLENDGVSVRERLDWLGRQPKGFIPQTYDQLASVYRRAGQERAARTVAVAKQWRSRSRWNPWNWLLYALVGYGYRNWLAAVWLAVLTEMGSLVFQRPEMTPLTVPHPAFHPVIYTLDALLPIVDLGQQSAWLPHGAAMRWSWFMICAGWVLTTAVIAGLAGVLKRDSPTV